MASLLALVQDSGQPPGPGPGQWAASWPRDVTLHIPGLGALQQLWVQREVQVGELDGGRVWFLWLLRL